ncbi:MAG: 6,7-dimethyl-8-ribityllumazine synthase [Gammaproteobacteria bacterium]|nr:6,7-dimethyl-8-ribityllumazine synthase [Gammaproteobacteria bacterium]
MSLTSIDRSQIPRINGGLVAIVESKWHANLVGVMAFKCKGVLISHGVTQVDSYRVPGTLEIPLAVKALAEDKVPKYDAFVCLSVVEKGSTAHFDMIVHATTQTLQQLSVDLKVPVINEILAVYDLNDAIARASNDEYNKGIEAAAAALEMMHLIERLE